jgi:hypothetical protein
MLLIVSVTVEGSALRRSWRAGRRYPVCVGLIFEVRAQGGERVHSFGARRTRDEAEQLLVESRDQVTAVGGHNDRHWVEPIDKTGMFEVPSRPTPRERFTTRITPTSAEGAWSTVRVEILDAGRLVATYDRDYAMLRDYVRWPTVPRSRPPWASGCLSAYGGHRRTGCWNASAKVRYR